MELICCDYVRAVVRVEEIDVIVQEDEGTLQDLFFSRRAGAYDEMVLAQQSAQSLKEERVLKGEREVDPDALREERRLDDLLADLPYGLTHRGVESHYQKGGTAPSPCLSAFVSKRWSHASFASISFIARPTLDTGNGTYHSP